MKKIRITIISILLLGSTLSFAQVEVGQKVDINGEPFNGFFDPFTYAPQNKLSVVHNSDSYEVGHYYNKNGSKIKGLIKFQNKKIWYKRDKNDTQTTLRPDEVNSFVIGVDSFFVAHNFYYKNRLKTKPEFVQYITEIDNKVFAKHYHFQNGIGQTGGIIESYLVKSANDNKWGDFPDNTNFKKNALKHFGHIKILNQRITDETYDSQDMLSVIKTAEYLKKYQFHEPIYYDKYWQEVRNKENAFYRAEITNKVDSIWTLVYFKDATKLYEANYSSFYPNTKNGEFISYYPNGEKRKRIDYKNNKPRTGKTFDKSGKLKADFKYEKIKDPYSTSDEFKITYNAVYDAEGNNILKTNGNATHIIQDDFGKVSYTQTFNDNKLFNSYRQSGENTIYQLPKSNTSIKIKSLQRKLDTYMVGKEYNSALSVNAQGIVLISFVIDDGGYAVEYSILNKIHPELDRLVSDFVDSKFSPTISKPHKFKAFKMGKKKHYCEFVVPLEFSINRFYRASINYYHWHMQHMMHNFTMPAPRFSGGF